MDNSQYNYTDLDKLSADVNAWAEDTEKAVKAEGNRLGIQHLARSPSQRDSLAAVKGRVYYDRDGMVKRIGYKMSRHLVFVHKGVGKDTPITMVGRTARQAKPWFNPVVEQRLPDLATKVAANCATIIARRIFIK